MPQPRSSKTARPLVAGGLLALFLTVSLSNTRAQAQPWMDTSLPPEQRASLLLSAMTLDEKLAMVHGSSVGSAGYVGHVPAIPRLAIPELILQDGPAGVAGGLLGVTAFPAPITVAASWDVSLMEQYGVAMAEEERAKGANVQLGPMMNIDRVPQAGRNFEGFGEDPYLAAQMAAAAVKGIQSTGVIATAKHFIDNDQEYQRTTISSVIDARTQHEIYLPPFKASVQAGVGAVMCSYNLINGIWACENPAVQNTLLKDELGFTGWIMSDWGATHSAAPSALGGLDMEMPSGINFIQLKQALQSGQLPQSRLDDMVTRILVPMFRMGLFERGRTGVIGAVVQSDAHTKLARDAAAQGVVLLKNDNAVLPLDPAKIRSLAVFGSAAEEELVVVGGGSGRVTVPYAISPLQGMLDQAGDSLSVTYSTLRNLISRPIPSGPFKTPSGVPGLKAEYFISSDLSGSPVLTLTDATIDFDWASQPPASAVVAADWSVRWTGTFTPPDSGWYNLGLTSTGAGRVYIDDKLVLDSSGAGGAELTIQPLVVHRRFTGGQAHSLRVEYSPAGGPAAIHLTWFTPADDPNEAAALIAARADAAVVVVGVNSGEGSDRQDLDLPDEALIRSIAAANERTVVVVYNPAQVLLPWADQLPAILIGWIPGQEIGHALADVLFGDVNPSAKLPMTYARDAADYPTDTASMYPGVNGQVIYSEGLNVGYRHFDANGIAPLFPFGHGLSYTTFEYANLVVNPPVAVDGNITIELDLTNTGQRSGAEVAQLYLGLPSETSEPPRQLKGFQKVLLESGQTQHLSFTLSTEDYSFWSAGLGAWVAYPGTYQVFIGSSSRDIRQNGSFTVEGGPLSGATTQAETAILAGSARFSTDQSGYTGSGYVGHLDQPGSSASFKVSQAAAGEYLVTVRYASTLRPGQQNTPRSLSLYANGVRVSQVALPNLANWTMWDFKTEKLDLNAGDNTITYQVDSGDSGDVLLDSIIVAPATQPTPLPSESAPAPAVTQAPSRSSTLSLTLPIILLALAFLAVGLILLRRSRLADRS